jgi:hypothetical protein
VLLGDLVSLSTSGAFADKNAGSGKTVNVGGTLSGMDAGNYVLSANATTLADITPKTITGALTAASKVYDGTLAAIATGTLNGVVLGDAVAVNGTGAFADKNVGTGKTVAVSGTLTGQDAGNYLLVANNTTTADITPKALTGAITAAGKTYDGTTAATTSGQLSGVVAGDAVTLATTGAFADKNAGAGKRVDVSGALVGADAGNYTVSANAFTTASISARQLTGALGAQDKVYDGNSVASVLGADAIQGIIAGDALGFAGAFADKNAGERKAVAFSLTGEDAGNYVLNVAQARATIARRVLGIDGTVVDGKTYDGGTDAQARAGSLTNLVEGETLGVSATARYDSASAGERNATVHYALADSGTGLAGNYVLADTQHQAVIDRRAITVAADDKTKRAGEADPALTWSVTQGTLVGDDTLAGVLSRAPGETAGSYRIGAGGLGNANYRIAAVDGTLLIENAVQPDTRREAALSAAQLLRTAVGTANSTEPDLSGGLSFVPVSSGREHRFPHDHDASFILRPPALPGPGACRAAARRGRRPATPQRRPRAAGTGDRTPAARACARLEPEQPGARHGGSRRPAGRRVPHRSDRQPGFFVGAVAGATGRLPGQVLRPGRHAGPGKPIDALLPRRGLSVRAGLPAGAGAGRRHSSPASGRRPLWPGPGRRRRHAGRQGAVLPEPAEIRRHHRKRAAGTRGAAALGPARRRRQPDHPSRPANGHGRPGGAGGPRRPRQRQRRAGQPGQPLHRPVPRQCGPVDQQPVHAGRPDHAARAAHQRRPELRRRGL